jgi:hypothetical protein
MFANLARTFVRKALYGAAGAAALWLMTIASAPAPADHGAGYLWRLAVVPLVTGLAAVLTRAANQPK